MFHIINILWVCFLSHAAFADGQNETEQLVTVIMIFRHGDRVIINPYPTDPYKNSSYWPAGWGQLTNLGKLQQYELGTWLRNRYQDFLPVEYSEKDIYIRSTDVDRTLMSAEANLAGMYPPQGEQIWDKRLSWQPIPIHTMPELEDYILAMKKPCSKYEFLKKELLKSPEFQEINLKYKDLISYVAENAGTPITNFESLEYIYSTLFIERSNNFTLPDWTKSVFPDKIKPLAELSFAIPCYTHDMARLKAGPFFHELLSHIFNATDAIKHRKPTKKVWMYSGHDVTIASILQSLKVFQYHTPPYTSTILFEVRMKKSGQFFVNMLYKNTSTPQKMILKGCDYDCPLEDFVNIVDTISLDAEHWERECKLSLLVIVQSADREELLIVAAVLFISLIMFVVMLKIIYSRYNKSDTLYLRLPDDDEHV